jgi:hypothetical protein
MKVLIQLILIVAFSISVYSKELSEIDEDLFLSSETIYEDAQPGEYPWTVALLSSLNVNLSEQYFCGGALIAPHWVITSASCVEARSVKYVLLKAQNFNIDRSDVVNELKRIEKNLVPVIDRIKHPEYSDFFFLEDPDYDYNIALLKLEKKISLPYIQMVDINLKLESRFSKIIGWGLVDGCENTNDFQLQQLFTITNRKEKCLNWANKTICAGIFDENCPHQRADGNPLIVYDNHSWKLAGILNWDATYSGYRNYGLFSRIPDFIDFISNNIYNVDFSLKTNHATEGDGIIKNAGSLELWPAPASDIQIKLSCSSASEINIPSEITIPAGYTSMSFDIEIIDNKKFDGTKEVDITVKHPLYPPKSLIMTIDDNESGELKLDLNASRISFSEKEFPKIGKVTIPDIADSDLKIFLNNPVSFRVNFPESVVITKGYTNATFDITLNESCYFFANYSFVITASIPNWQSDSVEIEFVDDRQKLLNLSFPDKAIEGQDVSVSAKITLSDNYTKDLHVSIHCNDMSEISIPNMITIPAYNEKAIFEINILDDSEVDEIQTVKITVSSPGWVSTAKEIYIGDNEKGIVDFMSDKYEFNAKANYIEIPVKRDFNTKGMVSVAYHISRNTYTLDILNIPTSGRLFFYEGESKKRIRIPLTGFKDWKYEQYKFYIHLSAPQGGVSIGDIDTANIIINFDEGNDHYPLSNLIIPNLFLSLPEILTEEDKHLIQKGMIFINEPSDQDLYINLSSNCFNALEIPSFIVIPAGLTSTIFDLHLIDDELLTGTQSVQVHANANGYQEDIKTITIHDNDTNTLFISFLENSIPENNEVVAKVYVEKAVNRPVTVKLQSSDTTEAIVPDEVIIPENETFANFIVKSVNDGIIDDDQPVGISAHVENWISAKEIITVKNFHFPYLTEIFTENVDLSYQTLTFTPDNSDNGYHLCRTKANELFSYPSDEDELWGYFYYRVFLKNNAVFNFFGVEYSNLYVGIYGNILFSLDSNWQLNEEDHFRYPGISALFGDFKSQIFFQQLDEKVVITFNIKDYFDEGFISAYSIIGNFQVELFFNGIIRITYLDIPPTKGIIGLSRGNGISENFIESDLSSYPYCTPYLSLSIPELLQEKENTLKTKGVVVIDTPLDMDLPVTIHSNNPLELTLSNHAIIPAGLTIGYFDINIIDDEFADGSQAVCITATSIGYIDAFTKVFVHDNEIRSLSLELPQYVSEGKTVTGQISVEKAVEKDVNISLFSSDTSEIVVPEYVTIFSGDVSAKFNITVIYDELFDNAQTVNISAKIKNWHSAHKEVQVNNFTRTYLTEKFYYDDFDLSYKSLTFTPDGSGNFYRINCCKVTDFFCDPSDGELFENIGILDEQIEIKLKNGNTITFFNKEYSKFSIADDGTIKFSNQDSWDNSTSCFYDSFFYPRISAFSTGSTDTSQIRYKQLTDRAVITYFDQYLTDPSYQDNYQVEIFYEGMVRITYLKISFHEALVGLSDGKGLPNDFSEIDMSSYPKCYPEISIKLNELTENDGYKQNLGIVEIENPFQKDLTVSLESDNPQELTISEKVIIPAGQTIGYVDINVVNDELLDGSQSLNIYSTVSGCTDKHTIIVHDDEHAELSLSLPEYLTETGRPMINKASVRVSSPVDKDTVVHLLSNDTSEIIIPEKVIIQKGETSTPFSLTAVYDYVRDYTQTVKISANINNWTTAEEDVQVLDCQRDYFTEEFDTYNFDLSNQTLIFVPDSSANYYQMSRKDAYDFPSDPTGNETVNFNNYYKKVSLLNDKKIKFFDIDYSEFYILNNGGIVFSDKKNFWKNPLSHFEFPRISALSNIVWENQYYLYDYDYEEYNASMKQLNDKFVITFFEQNNITNGKRFQIELFFEGVIRITYLNISKIKGIVGLSDGKKCLNSYYEYAYTGCFPPDYKESNLNFYFHPKPQLFIKFPVLNEKDENKSNMGIVEIECPKENDLIINLKTNNSEELTVSEYTIIPSGLTIAHFDYKIFNDNLVDASQPVEIYATANGCKQGVSKVFVHDNESNSLSLELPEVVTEGLVKKNQARIILAKPADKTLPIIINSSDTSEIIVPSEVYIQKGETSAAFDLTIVYDHYQDNNQSVTISASVLSWNTDIKTVKVIDYQKDYLTEYFYSYNFDLSNKSLTFIPDNSPEYYRLCISESIQSQITSSEGTTINFDNHTDDEKVSLIKNTAIKFYGKEYSDLYIGKMGVISFKKTETDSDDEKASHFDIPRISACPEYLMQSEIIFYQLNDKILVTFKNPNNDNSIYFQIEIFFQGMIRIIYFDKLSPKGYVGLSSGTGYPYDFIKSNLSIYPNCTPSLCINLPQLIETDTMVSLKGSVGIETVFEKDIFISLMSDNNSELTVSENAIIPEGFTIAYFDINVIDDQLLDGSQPVGIYATAPECIQAYKKTYVHDNETEILHLKMQEYINDKDPSIEQGVVYLDQAVDKDVIVSLKLSDTDSFKIPDQLTIPKGMTSVSFDLNQTGHISNNQVIRVFAYVENWTSAVKKIYLLEENFIMDIDKDGQMDLKDAMIILQIITSIYPEVEIGNKDLNRDGLIGWEEFFYIMNKLKACL